MKTGDSVRDGNGRIFQVGPLLGRGAWGKTYAVKVDGADLVMKVPLGPEDLTQDRERMAQACREIALEYGRLAETSGAVGFAPVEARFVAADGTPILVLRRAASSAERRIAEGASYAEVLDLALKAAQRLRDLREVIPVHGNLHPGNILIDERGEVWLTDAVTPAFRPMLPRLARNHPAALPYLPPEVRDASGDPAIDPATDTYAIAMLVLAGALTPTPGTRPVLPAEGLDKQTLVTLKDRVLDRLKAEHANPRFHTRLADHTATLLNRALSRETSPSPPYRFARLDEFLTRLGEVRALVHPAVEHVGRVLLDRPPGNDAFSTDEEVAFSCTIGCTPGVEVHDEIGCGIAVFDRSTEERLRNVAAGYTVTRHPTGRFRFGFRLAGLAPAEYRVRIAFTIRESGDEPATAEGTFTVRAAAGYVPPRAAPAPRPLTLDRPETEPATVTREAPQPQPPGDAPSAADEGGTLSGPAPSPTPIAPPVRPVDEPPVRSRAPAVVTPLHASDRLDGPEPDFEEDLSYQGAGRWTDLPLPNSPGIDPDPEDDGGDPDPFDADPRQGPLGGMVSRVAELVRGDAYLLFLGAAGFVIIVLLAALVALT